MHNLPMRDFVPPFTLIAAGVTKFLHYHFGRRRRFLAPGLFIVTGTLMLVARMEAIPEIRSGDPAPNPSNPE